MALPWPCFLIFTCCSPCSSYFISSCLALSFLLSTCQWLLCHLCMCVSQFSVYLLLDGRGLCLGHFVSLVPSIGSAYSMCWHHQCLWNESIELAVVWYDLVCVYYLSLPLLPESVTSMRGQALRLSPSLIPTHICLCIVIEHPVPLRSLGLRVVGPGTNFQRYLSLPRKEMTKSSTVPGTLSALSWQQRS